MKKPTPFFSRQIDDAIIFAAKAHKDQFRKTDLSIPYVSHPIGVGLILHKAGFSDDVIIAGILHDVVEDCDVTINEIRSTFGNEIAFLIEKVSENKELSWLKRKEEYLQVVLNAPIEVKAIVVADKLHNIQSIIKALENKEDIWKFFNKDKKAVIENYINFVKNITQKWDHPLLTELEVATRHLKKITG